MSTRVMKTYQAVIQINERAENSMKGRKHNKKENKLQEKPTEMRKLCVSLQMRHDAGINQEETGIEFVRVRKRDY